MWSKLGAALACLAMGAVVGYAANSGGDAAGNTTPTAAAARRPVEVRTVTIHKTVRVVRHEKPRHKRQPSAASPVATAPRVASAAPPPRPVASAAPRGPSRLAPAPVHNTAPVTTRTSGATGHDAGEDDGEGERDDD
jgi:hypothetical protein